MSTPSSTHPRPTNLHVRHLQEEQFRKGRLPILLPVIGGDSILMSIHPERPFILVQSPDRAAGRKLAVTLADNLITQHEYTTIDWVRFPRKEPESLPKHPDIVFWNIHDPEERAKLERIGITDSEDRILVVDYLPGRPKAGIDLWYLLGDILDFASAQRTPTLLLSPDIPDSCIAGSPDGRFAPRWAVYVEWWWQKMQEDPGLWLLSSRENGTTQKISLR